MLSPYLVRNTLFFEKYWKSWKCLRWTQKNESFFIIIFKFFFVKVVRVVHAYLRCCPLWSPLWKSRTWRQLFSDVWRRSRFPLVTVMQITRRKNARVLLLVCHYYDFVKQTESSAGSSGTSLMRDRGRSKPIKPMQLVSYLSFAIIIPVPWWKKVSRILHFRSRK